MADDQKLASLFRALQTAGIDVLVMGGHAVRYYGVYRNTVDFDLVTAVATPDALRTSIERRPEFANLRWHPVWRFKDFARFEVGKLDNGKEEWLEFWIRNHLLADYPTLKSRAETGEYGGADIAFISIADLIRSKETEREADWQDIAKLIEIADSRNYVAASRDSRLLPTYLADVRSRRGMDRIFEKGLASDPDVVETAASHCTNPIPYAFLSPLLKNVSRSPVISAIDPSIQTILQSAKFGSARHFAVIELVRLDYRRKAEAADRADKQIQRQLLP